MKTHSGEYCRYTHSLFSPLTISTSACSLYLYIQTHTHSHSLGCLQMKQSILTQLHRLTLDVGILLVSHSLEVKHPCHPHAQDHFHWKFSASICCSSWCIQTGLHMSYGLTDSLQQPHLNYWIQYSGFCIFWKLSYCLSCGTMPVTIQMFFMLNTQVKNNYHFIADVAATLNVLWNSAGLAQMLSNEMRPLSEEIKKLEGAVSICTVQKSSLTAITLLYANSESPCSVWKRQSSSFQPPLSSEETRILNSTYFTTPHTLYVDVTFYGYKEEFFSITLWNWILQRVWRKVK